MSAPDIIAAVKPKRALGQKSANNCLTLFLTQRQLCGAVSTDRRNTLIFFERWSISHEVSSAYILHSQAEVRDVGSLLSYNYTGSCVMMEPV